MWVTERQRAIDREERKRQRELDKEKTDLVRQEAKLVAEIKQVAKKGDKQVLAILAKQLVNVRKQKAKIFVVGSKMQSLGTQQRVRGCLMATNAVMVDAISKTTEVCAFCVLWFQGMKEMSKALDPGKMQETMKEFGMENARMSMTEDMINDVMDDIMEGSGDEEESNAIVSQVLDEIGIDISGQMLKAPIAHGGLLAGEASATKSDEELEQMLAQLKS
ncbi:hypothetical protein NP493_582g03050 [Ridgeia piscesae]|uniref:Uncharacterized protein n=1 Tax=Ridgeia piscesae TaxID=27915 RepID=A0AAD9KUW1_RIDPI|nr:hypothetical protein NP493_582g03050 [Ridgeia piscesae]